MIHSQYFPRLTERNHRETSPATPEYNCVAWAVGDTERWWEPGKIWLPHDWPKHEVGLGALERLFLELQYVNCDSGSQLEPGFEKVALYGENSGEYLHAARQLSNGKWSSKLGEDMDIEHDTPEQVAGGLYGEVMQVMKRRLPTTPHISSPG